MKQQSLNKETISVKTNGGKYYVVFVTPSPEFVATYTFPIDTSLKAQAHADWLRRHGYLSVKVVKEI